MHSLFQFFLRLGAAGPFLLGVADSSFLVLPFGNDLLLLILVARRHSLAWEYVPVAAAGSVIGIALLDFVCRRGGEAGLQKVLKPKQFERLERKSSRRAGYAVAIACLAPPPFPFTAVIAASSAFQYSRARLFSIAFVSRMIRFSIVAVLAVIYGPQIRSIVQSPAFFSAMIGLIAICVVASVYSVVGWIRGRSK